MINYWQRFSWQNWQIKKFAKTSRRQIKTPQSLDIPVLEISKLILHQIAIFEKLPNIIAAKFSGLQYSYNDKGV